MNTQLQKTGRIIYALPMAVFGIEHLIKAQSMAGLVPGFIPGGIFWVYVTGLALLAAAISIISKKWIWWSSLLLAGMLTVFVLTIHLPGIFNPEQMQMAMISVLKDISLAGSALYIAAINQDQTISTKPFQTTKKAA